ncbi:hypothetical protein ACFQZ9_26050, partial [Neobacillus sp. GCM10027624]
MSIYFEYLLILSNNMLINAEIWFSDFFSSVEKCIGDRGVVLNKPMKAKTHRKSPEKGLHEGDESQNSSQEPRKRSS